MDVTFLLVMIENPGLRHFVALDEIFHNLISARPRQLPACASLTNTALVMIVLVQGFNQLQLLDN